MTYSASHGPSHGAWHGASYLQYMVHYIGALSLSLLLLQETAALFGAAGVTAAGTPKLPATPAATTPAAVTPAARRSEKRTQGTGDKGEKGEKTSEKTSEKKSEKKSAKKSEKAATPRGEATPASGSKKRAKP